MSTINSISSSLTSLLTTSLSTANTTTATADTATASTATDIVSLLGDSGSDSSDAVYNILLSSANAAVMCANPSLLDALASTIESSDSTTALEDALSINLITISSEDLLSLLQEGE
jgi:hypothetical protein